AKAAGPDRGKTRNWREAETRSWRDAHTRSRREIMELLLILIYTSICYAIFKIFRIPVNQWTLATATLGGIFMIALILLVMNYNHPFTKDARIYFVTTPIIPDIKGRVVEVAAEATKQLKPGDILFRI